jgi:hypothetical protein
MNPINVHGKQWQVPLTQSLADEGFKTYKESFEDVENPQMVINQWMDVGKIIGRNMKKNASLVVRQICELFDNGFASQPGCVGVFRPHDKGPIMIYTARYDDPDNISFLKLYQMEQLAERLRSIEIEKREPLWKGMHP